MKALGKTIFVYDFGAFVGKDGNQLSVKLRNGEISKIPLGNIEAIVLSSSISLSTTLVAELSECGIVCLFLDWAGRLIAKIDGKKGKNIFFRKHQLKAATDPGFSLDISKWLVYKKIESQLHIFTDLNTEKYLIQIKNTNDYSLLLGIEGFTTKLYFEKLREEFRKRSFTFFRREYHPSNDASNCLLSIAYSLLTTELCIYMNIFDFDEGWGFLHKDYYGRDSLLCDLIEPFRAPIADQYVLWVINELSLKESDFGLIDNKFSILDRDKRNKIFKLFRSHYYTDEMRQEILDFTRMFYNKVLEYSLNEVNNEAA